MGSLLWIEHDGKTYHPASLNLVAAAQCLSKPCTALVIGDQLDSVLHDLSFVDGIDEIIGIEADYYFPFRAEPIAKVLAHYAAEFSHILAASSTQAKNIFPRMSALCDQSMLTDVLEIVSADTFVRPSYAGNVLVKEQFLQSKVIMTIRSSAFPKASLNSHACTIRKMPALDDDARTKVLTQAKRDEETQDLQTAQIVVSGGRGFGSAENFRMLEELAKMMGAGVGATRAAVDAGFISNDHQVGQTGKNVAPELYMAIGISGAVQHLAGMKDSKVIVAINQDPEAPIFEVATYALVGDLFVIVPKIMEELGK